MNSSLKGRTIVLAGGSGGLGAGTAEKLAAEGADLIITFKSNEERALPLSRYGRIVQADITSAADRSRLLREAPELFGLVVFTGTPARSADPLEAMQISHEVNYLGPILLARAAAEMMKASATQGAIVLFSTMQGAALFPGSTAYAAPKAALIHAARILAKECRGSTNIRVNVICPGVHAAGMAEASIAAGKYDHYLEDGAIHRFGTPSDPARAVRFFLEPDNYITGQVLVIDGGLTL